MEYEDDSKCVSLPGKGCENKLEYVFVFVAMTYRRREQRTFTEGAEFLEYKMLNGKGWFLKNDSSQKRIPGGKQHCYFVFCEDGFHTKSWYNILQNIFT